MNSGAATLSANDIRDLPGFCEKLRRSDDELSAYLCSRLSPTTHDLLKAGPLVRVGLEQLPAALVQDLNRIVEGELIYDERRFRHVALREVTRQMLQEVKKGESVAAANIQLLEEAFPKKIARTVKWAHLQNEDLEELAALVKTRRGPYLALSAQEKLTYMELRLRLEYFLRQIVQHEAVPPNLAARVVEQARERFFERIGFMPVATTKDKLIRKTSEIIWRLHTFRSWVVRQVKLEIRDKSRTATGTPISAEPAGATLPEEHRIHVQVRQRRCELGQRRPTPKLAAIGRCQRACDVLFLHETLKLTNREVGYVLGLPSSTADKRVADCKGVLRRVSKTK